MTSARILLVEDNAVNRKVAVHYLTKLGYTVDVAVDGVEAVESHARPGRTHYAVILMDCQMPRMDGYEATTRIRAAEGAEAHTPIIAITANATAADRDRCLRAGMDDYLPKPLDLDVLRRTLEAWLS